MKKVIYLFLAVLLFPLFAFANPSFERPDKSVWYSGTKAVKFGATPNAQISYTGGNLVLDILSGGGKVSFPDGITVGTGGIEFISSLVFEGTTADAFETTITVTDPTADRTITVPDATGTVILSGGTAALGNITSTGTITSSAADSIGWTVVSAPNQACNTTCASSGCVFGQDAGASNVIVNCASATADVCICAGN